MQIQKINNNKLKVILNSNDLNEKNIDIDSFLSHSIESQDLFFEILDLAEEEYDFDIENNKAVVETISLDNKLFILTITKLKQDSINTYEKKSTIYCFNNIFDIFNIYLSNHNILNTSSIYKLNNKYYVLFKETNLSLENSFCEFSKPIKNSDSMEDILIEYGKKVN